MKRQLVTAVSLLLMGWSASAKTVRATDLGSSVWAEINKASFEDLTIEFRQGDRIPASFVAEGDLFETIESSVASIGIKKSFWIKIDKNQILMSFDNVEFKDFQKVISGSFKAGTGADQNGGPVNSLQLVLNAFLK